MANAEQLALLKAGVEGWNKWRREDGFKTSVDLRGGDLSGANLSNANLKEANLHQAILTKANLQKADLFQAYLVGADLTEANLIGALLNFAILNGVNFHGANLSEAQIIGSTMLGANLSEANVKGAKLNFTNLSGADLSAADFSSVDLTGASLVNVRIDKAKVSGSSVYGISAWDLMGEFEEQKDLIITRDSQPPVTVDNIKVAQFIYLILNNKEIRDVINTLTSKAVLILGRFTIPERKAILDRLRDKLREYNLLPIVFDFDRPTGQDFTETIKTLASISYFVIADVTNPKSSPLELQATIPDYQIPFVPIIQEGEYPFPMMVDLQKKYNWVLDTISYDSLDTLIEILKPHIIDPAIRKRDELRLIKAKEPTIISGKALRDKGKA